MKTTKRVSLQPYDHILLNIGRDSFPIGTITSNYNYTFLRIPIGIQTKLLHNKNYTFKIGLEYLTNFLARRKYNGGLPFKDANTSYNKLRVDGNSVMFYICIQKKSFSLDPTVRLYNVYKMDRILFENEDNSNVRFFDAFGLSLTYSFNSKK